MTSFHLLTAGYFGDSTASTVSLIESEDSLIVIDPGMVRSRGVILDPMQGLGHSPEEVTDVVISHHHPDHTINVGMFANARVHDHWAIYHNDMWLSRSAEGHEVAPGVTLWETPGHTAQDITTIVETDQGVVALTHLWWHESSPFDDPLGTDQEGLHVGRARVLERADLIVPGHGEPFTPGPATSR